MTNLKKRITCGMLAFLITVSMLPDPEMNTVQAEEPVQTQETVQTEEDSIGNSPMQAEEKVQASENTTDDISDEPEPIKPVTIKECVIDDIEDQIYTGFRIEPEITVRRDEYALVCGEDYTVTYSSNTKAGTGKATIQGIGNYTGKVKKTFKIKPKNLSSSMIPKIPVQPYSIIGARPVLTIAYNGKVLKEGKDYKAVYKNNKKVGTAAAVYTGTGNYTGSVSRGYRISKIQIPFKKNLVPKSRYKMKCPYGVNVKYITIHNTATDLNAPDQINAMIKENKERSFHFAVDEKQIVQGISEGRNAWHAGQRTGNMNSLSIEICYSKSGGERFLRAEDNAAKLAADLLNKYNLSIDKLKTHKSWSGKNCPELTMKLGWQRFVNMVRYYMKGEAYQTKLPGTSPKRGTVRTIGSLTYKITKCSRKDGTVSVKGVKKKSVKSVSIPGKVKIKGYTYKVTSIGTRAFDGCRRLKKIKVKSTGIRSAGKNAFRRIHKRAVIKVPASKYKKYKKIFKKKGQAKTVKIRK